MNFNPIGDLAQSLMLRRQGNSLRQELSALTAELSSGKSRDLAHSLRGNFSTISAVGHSLALQDGYTVTRNTVGQIFEVSQSALSAMQGAVDRLGPPLLNAATSGVEFQVDPYVSDGPDLFADLVVMANTQHAGRYVFSGTEFDKKPVEDSTVMLNDMAVVAAGATTASGFLTAIDDWFDNPVSGFSVSGYLGGNPATGTLDVSSSQSVKIETTADNQAFKEAFKNAATLALIERGDFLGSGSEKIEILQAAAHGLMKASSGLVSIQADIGSSQQRVSAAATQSSLEKQMLQTVKNEIVSVDPFEAATKLEAVQTQLESLYLITARTSRLNLSEYLR